MSNSEPSKYCLKCQSDLLQQNSVEAPDTPKTTTKRKGNRKITSVIKWLCIGFIIGGLIASLFTMSKELKATKEDLQIAQFKVKKSLEDLDKLNAKISFIDSYLVIVTTIGNSYHKYDCDYVNNQRLLSYDDQCFWIYNVHAAASKGYTPCDKCNPPLAYADRTFEKFSISRDEFYAAANKRQAQK